MDHPIAHPRNALLIGLMFLVLAVIYLAGWHDAAGATMLLCLGIAMSLAFYALAAGSPRG